MHSNKNSQYFADYMRCLSKISDKVFDFKTNSWRMPERSYEFFSVLALECGIDVPTVKPVVDTSAKKTAVKQYDDIGKSLKLKPYDYQKETIAFCLQTQNALIVLPCGSGKTPIGLGLYVEAKNKGLVAGPGLIVVKSSLKKQWLKEVEKFTDLKATIINTYKKVAALSKNKDTDEVFKKQFEGYDLYIVNYETLRDTKVRSELHKCNIEFVFADEVHYIKSHTAVRSKALYELNDCKLRFGATATPVSKSPEDVFGIFRFIKPDLFPKVGEFTKTYIKFNSRGFPIGGKNLNMLNKKISPYMIVKTKEEIGKQLPKMVVLQRYCDLEPAQAEMTKRLLKEIEDLKAQQEALAIESAKNPLLRVKTNKAIEQIKANVLARQIFAQELVNSEQLLAMSDSDLAKKYITGSNDNKMDLLIDLLEEILESGEKVCVFSRFQRMQDVITARIENEAKKPGSIFKGVKIAYVNGSLTSDQRYDQVYNKFSNTDEYKILLCSDAGAEGLNLSKCKYLIEMDLAESYTIQTQRHGRLERADSVHDTVFVYQLIANNSWDEIAMKIVEKKETYDSEIVKGFGAN